MTPRILRSFSACLALVAALVFLVPVASQAAITTAVSNTAKQAAIDAICIAGRTYRLVLIRGGHTGTYGASTTTYSAIGSDEVANGNGYTTGGASLTNRTTGVSSGTAYCDFDNVSWPAATFSSDGAALVDLGANGTLEGTDVVAASFSFGSTKTASGGSFDVTIPASGLGLVTMTTAGPLPVSAPMLASVLLLGVALALVYAVVRMNLQREV